MPIIFFTMFEVVVEVLDNSGLSNFRRAFVLEPNGILPEIPSQSTQIHMFHGRLIVRFESHGTFLTINHVPIQLVGENLKMPSGLMIFEDCYAGANDNHACPKLLKQYFI
ncbi:hypothetical protein D1122_20845 [Cereibacter sphaeroides]|nr:hypothetical protein D1122_20845 [Cereibacter sphaeroides]